LSRLTTDTDKQRNAHQKRHVRTRESTHWDIQDRQCYAEYVRSRVSCSSLAHFHYDRYIHRQPCIDSHSRTQRRSCLRILYYRSSYCGLGFTIISNLDRQTVLLSCTCTCKVMNWLPHWRQELVADKTITKPSTFVQFVIKVVGVVIIDLCSKSYKYFKFV
jgi:hypothetical protein